ncbi:MAG: VPGUxxT family thioredoxin-like (seleno)protein, type 2 [Planctomycetota bacterium]
MDYGRSVLSHPLMVEAIEDLFIPVLVYNNKPSDAATLKRFNEPSWNNPVVRYFDSNLKDVTPRKDGTWKINQVAAQMVNALQGARQNVPRYLLELAADASKQQTATFAMHCYWEGEGKLGSIDGVSDTISAWVGNLEVVRVQYDPQAVQYADLVETAQSFECASKVFAESKTQLTTARRLVGNSAESLKSKPRNAKLSDQKYYLRNTPYLRSLPLTRFQSTKINASLKQKTDFRTWLSPRQLQLLERLIQSKDGDALKFRFPENDALLPEYHERLLRLLPGTQ